MQCVLYSKKAEGVTGVKKLIAAMLALLLCLSFAACESDDDSDRDRKRKEKNKNPFVGTWEANVEGQAESIFEFSMRDDTLVGNWTLYDYVAGKWSENDFTVKEQTENVLTLLLDDGSLRVMPYTFLGHQLLIEDKLYSNPKSTPSRDSEGLLMYKGTNVQAYGGIYLGANLKCIQAKYPTVQPNEYGSYELKNLGTYDTVRFRFDSQLRLTKLELVEYTEMQISDQVIAEMNALYGEYTFSESGFDDYEGDTYRDEIYSWRLDSGVIQLSVTFKKDTVGAYWFTVVYQPSL